MRLSDFDYCLPKELIAQRPADERDGSRLLVLDRKSGKTEHTVFKNILKYLSPSDVLVLNDTAVFPARLIGRKKKTGGKIEIFLLREISKTTPLSPPFEGGDEGEVKRWEVLTRGKGDKQELKVIFGDGELECRISGDEAVFNCSGNIYDILKKYGQVPLPPYIKRGSGELAKDDDKERYQTVYAKNRGAVAAPTAGLHFTKELLSDIEKKGVEIAKVTLHVGYGTFKPVKSENIKEHKIDPEYYEIKESEAKKINNAVKSGRRIVAAGTTTVRTLESFTGEIKPWSGYTDLFIHNGFDFKITKALLTNFHLPKSSLLMLVCAFAGRDMILNAYNEAIKRGYRFYSYGDAMLIV